MNQPTNHITRIRKYLVWLFWIAVWQTANLLIHNNIIFVGPLDMVKALAEQAVDPAFWATILNSFARISLGFLGAFALSILLGSLAYLFPLVKELLDPVMLLIKSVPVASFVILALIWIGSRNLAVFTSFLVVVPMVYVSTLSGLKHTDKKTAGNGPGFPYAHVEAHPLYLCASPPSIPCKRVPYSSWYELEIRRGRGSHRHTGRFHWRTAVLLQTVS